VLAGCGVGQAGASQAGPAHAGTSQTRAVADTSRAAPNADSPAGFWYGTGSWPIAINSNPPYREPVLSGSPAYGGYIGMAAASSTRSTRTPSPSP
jgi:hypothetical protein